MATDRAAKKQPLSASIRDVQRDRENSHEVCPMALEITSTAREIGKLGLLAPWGLAKVAAGPTIRPLGPTQRPVHRQKIGFAPS